MGAAFLLPLHYGRSYLPSAIATATVSGGWFLFMAWFGISIATEEHIRFFSYYSNLGSTPIEALKTVVSDPIYATQTLLGYDHIKTGALLLASVGFLPLFRVRYLLPLLFPAGVYFFISGPLFLTLLKTHHAAFFIPWLVIGALYGAVSLRERCASVALPSWLKRADLRVAAIGVAACAIVGAFFSINPLVDISHRVKSIQSRDVSAYREIVQGIGGEETIISCNRFYPHLAHRQTIIPCFYLFTGKQLFVDAPYQFSENIEWILLERESVALFASESTDEQVESFHKRLDDLVRVNGLSLIVSHDEFLVYGKPGRLTGGSKADQYISNIQEDLQLMVQ